MKVKKILKDRVIFGFLVVSFIFLMAILASLLHYKFFQKFAFLMLGCWSLYLLAIIVYLVIKKLDLRFNSLTKIILAVTLILGVLLYGYSISQSKQLYGWDQRCYYARQVDLLKEFDKGFIDGLSEISRSTYEDDYGDFLLIFTSVPFSMTGRSESAFILVYAVVEVLPVMLMLFILGMVLIRLLKVRRKMIMCCFIGLWLVIFPLLHKAAMMGQPDVFGLFWIVVMMALTIDYDFSKREPGRYALVALAMGLAVITRRWYLFPVVGYSITYAVAFIVSIIRSSKKMRKIRRKNLLIFMGFAVVLVGGLVLPIILRTIFAEYATSYQAWNLGGVGYELNTQYYYLGILTIVLMIIGIGFGIIRESFRKATFLALGTYVLTFLLFTRIQNTYYHQSLIFVPCYFILCVSGFVALIDHRRTWLFCAGIIIASVFLANSAIAAYTYYKPGWNRLYSNAYLGPVVRSDYEEIGEVVGFLVDNTTEGDTIYPNFATIKYSGDILVYYLMPDESLRSRVIYESSIDSVHGFPIGILGANYVLVSNVTLDETGATRSEIIPIINRVFLEGNNRISEHFSLVKEFRMTDDITIYAYERISDYDEAEIDEWKRQVEGLSDKYPELFEERIDSFIGK